MAKTDIRAFERTRAANYVLEYENYLRDMLAANPTARNSPDVEKIVGRLETIRRSIMGSMKAYVPPIKRDPDGGFALEEIEAAMDFIKSEE